MTEYIFRTVSNTVKLSIEEGELHIDGAEIPGAIHWLYDEILKHGESLFKFSGPTSRDRIMFEIKGALDYRQEYLRRMQQRN